MAGRPDLSFLGIKQLLQQQVQLAIDLSPQPSGIGTGSTRLSLEEIPIQRLADDTCLVYRSAIALKLASLWQMQSFDLATQLAIYLPIASHQINKPLFAEFTVSVVPPGWIDFHLSDRGLAVWLQQLIEVENLSKLRAGTGTMPLQNLTLKANLFPLQYAHARCCSLLRLGHQEGLIELLSPQPPETPIWQIVAPTPIPWLHRPPQIGSLPQLCLVHPAERQLIAELLAMLDEGRYQKLATAFENFYSNCRIWGEVKMQTPDLAQGRLGLVAIARLLLNLVLSDWLGVLPLIDL